MLVKIKLHSTVHLDCQNYLVWKAHVLAHLLGYELVKFVERLVAISDPSLEQQDQLLLAWLFPTFSTFVLPQVMASHTSYEAWTTHESIFNTKSKSRIIQLQN